jgi:hypothetical protein
LALRRILLLLPVAVFLGRGLGILLLWIASLTLRLGGAWVSLGAILGSAGGLLVVNMMPQIE